MVNPQVGSIFEVAINDTGYMLADNVTDEQYRRVASRLEPERFASGETPVSESFDRYSFFNSSEWRGGAGQRFLNRNSSDKSSFWDSQGVDPFCECQRLHLLPDVDLKQAATGADCMAVAGSEYILLKDSATEVQQFTIDGDTVSAGDIHTQGTVTDMAIGYGKGFLATGTTLEEVTLGAAGKTTLSSLDVHRVAWIGDRLCVLYRDSGTSTWRFSSLDTSGTEEVSGGHLTIPGATNASMGSCAFRLGGMTSGINYVWFSGWTLDGDEALIYVWNIDTTLSPYIAMEMPKGEMPVDLFFYQGGLYVWAVTANDSKVKVYRCVVNGDGTLTPFLVVADAGTAPATPLYDGPKFAAQGRQVFFAWNAMQTNGGFGVIDLATGGYAKRGVATTTGEVVSVYVWGNRPGMSIASSGAHLEHSSDLVTTGWLKTSIADADSALDKRWDSLGWSADIAAGSITVNYTTDGGDTYTASSISAETGEEGVVSLGVESATLGLQISLTGTGSATPYIRVVSAKFHPLGLLDEILLLPIDCSDRVEGLNGADLGYTPDSGRARARALQDLLGNYVTVQDIDWPETTTTYDYEVIAVDIRRVRMAMDPSTRTNRSTQVALVSLRRDLSITAATAPSANNAPSVTNPGAQSDSVNVAITPLQLAATDADSDPLVWGAKDLPTGLTCDLNGRITGTPTATGAFSVTAYASDGEDTGSASFTWTIS